MRRVAITGLGAVTPVGNDAKTTWVSLLDGRSGIGPITTFDATTYPVRIAGEVKGFDPALAVPAPAAASSRASSATATATSPAGRRRRCSSGTRTSPRR
jgi:3-oxoacyl-[acyl-carrier-protein] synthase II